MLNARENMEEVINHGHPDRFSNNYEGIQILFQPNSDPKCVQGAAPVQDRWGIWWVFPEGTPGQFPLHDEEHLVLKDIEDWKEYVKAPPTDQIPDAVWDQFRQQYRDFDRSKAILATFYNPGLFEMTHHLGSLTEMLVNYLTETEDVIELIKYLEEYELKIAESICDNLKPDAIFHHDDWGSEENSFLRPELFDECFLEPYKNIYGYYKDHGVKYVFHHSDSYAANLVPEMIEMGIDVWQGAMRSNNIPELVEKYGDKITIMSGIDNKMIDFDGWTNEDCKKAFLRATEQDGLGPADFIPCISQGGPGSTVSGTYQALCDEIDKYNSEKFGFPIEDIQHAREPLQIMFG